MPFTLPPLPYAFDALEPVIDAKTVELHYTKHHQTYCDKLNAGLMGTEHEAMTLAQLLSNVAILPDNLKPIVKNHGGGLMNHDIYRVTMTPGWTEPSTEFKLLIEDSFGTREAFETEFKTKAAAVFGSGRTWLEKDGADLKITNYPNQENPLMYDKKPLLGLDVWEHAYYLHYQNRRPEYINGRRSIINWEAVEKMMNVVNV